MWQKYYWSHNPIMLQHNWFNPSVILTTYNKCKSSTLLHVHGLHLSVVCGLISYAGSSGSGQHGPHCRVAQQSPQGQALCSRSPGSNPLPCVPASVHMSSYGRHMWSRRKADAVFPFVKSRFWKAFSILMARVESQSVKGTLQRRGNKRSCSVSNANTATS